MTDWNSNMDEAPIGEPVQIFLPNNRNCSWESKIQVGFRHHDGAWVGVDGAWTCGPPTHWQPLPKEPER